MVRIYKNSGFAGEMLVAAELSRKGYEVLLGNVGTKKTTGVDLAAVDPESGITTSISVKSLKKKNAFLIDPAIVRTNTVYVFVITNEAGVKPDFFVIRGTELLEKEQDIWGKWGRNYTHKHGRGIMSDKLNNWRDNWNTIENINC